MKTIRLLLIVYLTVTSVACTSKCDKNNNKARGNTRNADLVGVWRYKLLNDSDFVILKPNGDFNEGSNFTNSNTWSKGVWYTHDNVIVTTSCENGDIPMTMTEHAKNSNPHWEYNYCNDTLYLKNYDDDASVYGIKTTDPLPYVRVLEY